MLSFAAIKKLNEKLGGEKLKLESGEEFDLTNPKDVERLRNSGLSGEDEGSFLDIQIDGQALRYNLSDDKEITDLQARLKGEKLKLESGEEYDLSKPEDIARLRGLSAAPAASKFIRELKYTKDGKQESEKYDLSKDEDVEKLLKYASGGRLFESERAEISKDKENVKGEKNVLSQHATYVGHSILNLISQNKMSSKDFMELPFEDFIGSSAKKDENGDITEAATDEGDRKLWNGHNTQAKKNNQILVEYQSGVVKMVENEKAMRAEFTKKHPEIEDVDKWISENISPYLQPILTYGKETYPADTFEMLWTWKNLDKVLENARKEGRREKATAVIKRGTNGSKISTVSGSALDKAKNAAKNLVSGGRADIQIAH